MGVVVGVIDHTALQPPAVLSGPGLEYCEWKDWSAERFGTVEASHIPYFHIELKRSQRAFPKASRVLEIGFGNGGFLGFARDQGWDVHGLECNPLLVETAQKNGFKVENANSTAGFESASFDLIVAFDVLEHLSRDTILPFLRDIQRCLKPGGVFLARFPNGDSPFSMRAQNADPTHTLWIGSGMVAYYAKALDLDTVYVGAQAVPLFGLKLSMVGFVSRLIGMAMRKLCDLCARAIQGAEAKNFSAANLVIILRRK